MRSQSNDVFEFGPFRLDVAERLLLRDGHPVALAPKVFDTLVSLARHNGHLLEKEQLMREVWPDTFVEEVNLAVNISTLRKVLGEFDDGRPYIETVSKRGYRFVAHPTNGDDSNNEAVTQHRRLNARIVSEEHAEREAPSLTRVASLNESPSSPFKRELHRGKWWTSATAVLVLLILATAAGFYQLVIRRGLSKPVFEPMKISRITNSGKVSTAAISPDGKYLAFVQTEAGKHTLWLRQLATASDVQIIPPTEIKYSSISFSRDGSFLYYVTDEDAGVLYRVPILGGASKRLIFDVDSLIALAPDGQHLAFLRGYPALGESVLFISNADGAQPAKISTLKSPDFFFTIMGTPAWSPDGKIIACPGGKISGDDSYMTVLGVRVDNGEVKPLTTQHWYRVSEMAWLAHGRGLVLTAKDEESSPSQLWYLSYPEGTTHRITNDLDDYSTVSVTADGKSLLTVKNDVQSRIWVGSAPTINTAKPIPSNSLDGVEGISWMPDGRIVYASRTSGKSDIWSMQRDGANPKRLTDAGNNRWPSASADGRYLVFMSDRDGAQNIWRMDNDGGNQIKLTSDGNDLFPDCAPDNQSVIYLSARERRFLFKVPINGGQAVQVTARAASRPSISPDGKLIACAYYDDFPTIKTAVYSFAGGEPLKLLRFKDFNLHWTMDSRELIYVDPNSGNLFTEPIDGSAPKQLTTFGSEQTFRFAWSRDGKELALVRGQVFSDAILISGF